MKNKIHLNQKQKQSIIDQVIEQIKKDLAVGDETAIDELLHSTPDASLIAFLPDDESPRV